MDKLAPWDSVRTLYNEFSKFLPYFEFEEYKKEVLQMLKVVETLQTKKEAGELEARAQKHVDTRLNTYMSNKDWEKEKAELN